MSRVSGSRPELGQHVVARHAGKHQVEDDDIGPLLGGRLEGLRPAGGGGHPIPGLGQVVGHQGRDVRFVIDHENAMRHDEDARNGVMSMTRLARPCEPGGWPGSGRPPDGARCASALPGEGFERGGHELGPGAPGSRRNR